MSLMRAAGAKPSAMACAHREIMLAATGRSYRHEPSDCGEPNGRHEEDEEAAADLPSRDARTSGRADENENSSSQDVGLDGEKSDEVATIDTDRRCSAPPSPLAQCKQASAASAAAAAAAAGEQVAVAVTAQTPAVTTKEFVSRIVAENSDDGGGGQENEPRGRAQSTDQQQRRGLSDGTRSVASDELISADAARPPSATGEARHGPAGERAETPDHATSPQQPGQQVGVIAAGANGEHEQPYDSRFYHFYIGDEEPAAPPPTRCSVLYTPQDVVSGCFGSRPASGSSSTGGSGPHCQHPCLSAYRGGGCSSSASNNSGNSDLSSQPGLVIDTDAASSCAGHVPTGDEFVPCSPDGYLLGVPGALHEGGAPGPLRGRRESSLMCEAFEQSVLSLSSSSSSSPRSSPRSSLGAGRATGSVESSLDGAPPGGGGGNSRRDTDSLTTPPPSLMHADDHDNNEHYYGDHFAHESSYEMAPYEMGAGSAHSSEPRPDDHQYCSPAPDAWTVESPHHHQPPPQTYHHRPEQHQQYLPPPPPPPQQQVAATTAYAHLQQPTRPQGDCQMLRSNEDYRDQTSSSGYARQYQTCASADAVVCHERGQQLIEWKPAGQHPSYQTDHHEQPYAPAHGHHQYATESYASEAAAAGHQDYQYAASHPQQQQHLQLEYEPEKTYHLLESQSQAQAPSTSGPSIQLAAYEPAANESYHESYDAGYYPYQDHQQSQYQQQGFSYESYNGTIGHESYANYTIPFVSDHYDPSVEIGSWLAEDGEEEGEHQQEREEEEASRSARPASRTEPATRAEQPGQSAATSAASKLAHEAAASRSTRAGAAAGGAKQQEPKKVGCSKETIAVLRSFIERRMMLKAKAATAQERQAQALNNPADSVSSRCQRAHYTGAPFSSYNSVQLTPTSFTYNGANRTPAYASQPSTSGNQFAPAPTRLAQSLPSGPPTPVELAARHQYSQQVAAGGPPASHATPQTTTTTTTGGKKANSLCSESVSPASSCGDEEEEREISPQGMPVIVFRQQEQRQRRPSSIASNNSATRRRARSRSRSGADVDRGRRSSDSSGASSSSGGSGPGEEDACVQTRASKRRRLQQQQQMQQQQQASAGDTKQRQSLDSTTCSQSASSPRRRRTTPSAADGADHAPSLARTRK